MYDPSITIIQYFRDHVRKCMLKDVNQFEYNDYEPAHDNEPAQPRSFPEKMQLIIVFQKMY